MKSPLERITAQSYIQECLMIVFHAECCSMLLHFRTVIPGYYYTFLK